MNISGLVGDTLSFMYAVDFEVEKSYYGKMEVNSCPPEIRDIIMQVKIGDNADLDWWLFSMFDHFIHKIPEY